VWRSRWSVLINRYALWATTFACIQRTLIGNQRIVGGGDICTTTKWCVKLSMTTPEGGIYVYFEFIVNINDFLARHSSRNVPSRPKSLRAIMWPRISAGRLPITALRYGCMNYNFRHIISLSLICSWLLTCAKPRRQPTRTSANYSLPIRRITTRGSGPQVISETHGPHDRWALKHQDNHTQSNL
jgi:hypothetical protein